MKSKINAGNLEQSTGTGRLWAIGVVSLAVGLWLPAAQATLLYHLPFEDGAGSPTLNNYGSVGGAATIYTDVFGGQTTPPSPAAGYHSAYSYYFPHDTDYYGTGGGSAKLPSSTTEFRLNTPGEAMTIATWVKWHPYTSDPQGIVATATGGDSNGWRFELTPAGNLEFWSINSLGLLNAISSTAIPQDVWTHVALTFQINGSLSMYINGQSVSFGQSGSLGVQTASPNPIKLGVTDGDANVDSLNGYLDDFRMYDTALSSQQILDLAVPEPSTIMLLAIGGLFLWRKRQ